MKKYWVQKWMRRIAHELGWQKSFQRLARYLGFYGTLDSEKASRTDKLKIIELQNALAERPIIYIYTDRRPAEQPITIDSVPSRTLQVQGIRQRANHRQLQASHGEYFQSRKIEFMQTS